VSLSVTLLTTVVGTSVEILRFAQDDIKDGAVAEVLLTDCCVSFSKWSLVFGLRCGLV